MEIWQAIILGLLQGLTEFLPVSSSGHLVIVQDFLGVIRTGVTFDIAVHLGTALAVAYYFRDQLWGMARNFRLLALLVVASIPAAVFGFAFQDFLEGLFSQVVAVGFALLVTGTILWLAETYSRQDKAAKNMEQISYKDALIIGLGQAVAIIPGISRSGSTIATALLRNVNRESAAEFSFLMSLPVILGAAFLELIDLGSTASSLPVVPILVGLGTAFFSGLAAIYFLLTIIRRHSLKIFSYYTWSLGVVVLLWNLI